jgi:hypothetical protein
VSESSDCVVYRLASRAKEDLPFKNSMEAMANKGQNLSAMSMPTPLLRLDGSCLLRTQDERCANFPKSR